MSQPIGMNVELVTELVASVRSQLVVLDEAAQAVDNARLAALSPDLWSIVPGGYVVSPLSLAAVLYAGGQVRNARAAVESLLGVLGQEAEVQTFVSGDGNLSYFFGGLDSRQARELYEQILADPDLLLEMGPVRVHMLFELISADQADELWQRFPAIIGNLDGVPFDIRINANTLNAMADLRSGDYDTEAQREYLQAVADHKFQLVTYDPENHRLVEALGLVAWDEEQGKYVYGREVFDDEGNRSIDRTPPGESITFVPGTGTKDEHFYRRDYGDIAEWFRDQDPNSVVFIYKDGVFPAGLDDEEIFPVGLIEANHEGFAASTALALTQFNENLGMESWLAGADQTAIGHSWGFANVASSEVAGAHWDTVISLAGAWVPDGWSADPDTEYSHHSYIDWLQLANDTPAVVGTSPDDVIPNTHMYEGPQDATLDRTNPLEVWKVIEANHTLIATSRRENHAVLYNLLDDIHGDSAPAA